ncbi:Calx-beta domain-containing protein [Candidatus Poriferisodalis sp.]|uniref:Calx-beta domain-containing protein n=1 Tax=Candidatus Poriferisodalis sp. TaxID=3101277 RepID=UPI003B029179
MVVLAGGVVPSAGAQSAAGGESGSGGVVLVVVNGSSLADVGVAAGLVGGGVGDVVVAAESAGGLGEAAGGVVRAAGVVSGVVLVGGEAALGGGVAAELESLVSGVVVERVSGADRVATAAAAARRVLAGRSGGAAAGVVLADGWSLADVGVAAAVAAAGGADVVLYSGSGSLPDQTRQVLAGEAVGGIVVVGGAAAVPDSVVAAAAGAAGGVGTERVGGADRVATAALAARRWAPGCAEAAVVANGWSQADVGTAAALAAALGDSVVLYTASADGLGSDTRSALGRVRPQLAVVVGDTDTISDDISGELAELGYPAARVTDPAAAARYALDNDLRNCRTTGSNSTGGSGNSGSSGPGNGGPGTGNGTTPPDNDVGSGPESGSGTTPPDDNSSDTDSSTPRDNDTDAPDVVVSFAEGSYRVEEGGPPVTVTVELSEAPQREVSVPLEATLRGTNRANRYSVSRSTLTFAADQTSATFTVTVPDDSLNNDGHRLSVRFGDLPPGFRAAVRTTALVEIVDDEIRVWLQRARTYAYEGGDSAQVRVRLDSSPTAPVTIPLTAELRGDASAEDFSYSVEDLSFDFGVGETVKTFTVTAVDDSDDDDGEHLVLTLGDLPDSVLSTTATSVMIHLIDDDGPFSRQPGKDFADLYSATPEELVEFVHSGSDPMGLWSDGTTMWVLFDTFVESIAAYDMSTRVLDPDRVIDTEDSDFKNRTPRPFDLWSDGDTVWVADHTRCSLFAFDLATRAYDGALDVDMSGHHGSRFCDAAGIWSDGDTVWVAEDSHDKIFAYSLATGERRSQHDITTIASAGATSPSALWSDGVTMWVIDRKDKQIYAFDLDSGARRSGLEFSKEVLDSADISTAHGIWSDGATMWVSDIEQEWGTGDHWKPGKIYAFSMPVSAALESLSVSGVEFGVFQTGIFSYEGAAAAGATSATVTAAAAFTDDATVTVAWEAADGTTGTGASATLSAGDNTITVSSSYDADGDAGTDNADVRVYTVTVTVPPAADD